MNTTKIKREQVIELLEGGHSEREVARRLKCSQASISRIKSGRQQDAKRQPRNLTKQPVPSELSVDELKKKALVLRNEGFTFEEIARCLCIAKGRAVQLVKARDLAAQKPSHNSRMFQPKRCPDCGGLINTKLCLACIVKNDGKRLKRPYVKTISTGYASLSVG